ncbi:MAG: hypothetical protein J0M02_07950 [Planctomycetes bacterium]|nr:hypothetical protein [Planctomycetota bacterium]
MSNAIRSGLTLIELTIAATIFALVAGVAGQSLISGTNMTTEIGRSSAVTEDTNRILQRIAGQLRSADYNWIYDNSNQPVPTWIFKVCTGLGVDPDKPLDIGPVFNQTYTIAYDSINGTLTATLADVATGKVIRQEYATDLRIPDGFRVGQLGTDVLVKGNQLSLAVARYVRDGHGDVVKAADGQPRIFESSTTVFLRSTIYANTNLTTTATNSGTGTGTETGSETGSETETGNEEGSKDPTPPKVTLNDDTSTKTSKVKIEGVQTTVNDLIIVGSVVSGSQETGDVLKLGSFSVTWNKQSPYSSISVEKGWDPSTWSGKSTTLSSDQFKISGWVSGSITFTVSITSDAGVTTTLSRTY